VTVEFEIITLLTFERERPPPLPAPLLEFVVVTVEFEIITLVTGELRYPPPIPAGPEFVAVIVEFEIVRLPTTPPEDPPPIPVPVSPVDTLTVALKSVNIVRVADSPEPIPAA
jgi:hypothetical protein